MATWADWSVAVKQAKLATTPAELHGSIAGYLCAGWGGSAHELLAALALESGNAGRDDALHRLVDAAARDIHERLARGAAIDPLLPQGRVAPRANSMVDWCRGFLGGLGLTGVVERHAHDPNTDGVLVDLGRIASSHLRSNDDDAESLATVLDFVRAAVVHLHSVFTPPARR